MPEETIDKINKILPEAKVAPVNINIKGTANDWKYWIAGFVIFILYSFGIMYYASSNKEEELIAEYEALAIADKELKMQQGEVAQTNFKSAKDKSQIRYIDRTKEIIKYVESPEAKNNSVACTLNDNFIRLYNGESASN